MATVELANDETHNLIIEILESGEPRIDWETLVCYQPMKWDDFATRTPRPAPRWISGFTSSRTTFTATNSRIPTHWMCFRLTALDSEETLFGYAQAGSAEAADLLEPARTATAAGRASLILRLDIPGRTPIPPRGGDRETAEPPLALSSIRPIPALDPRR